MNISLQRALALSLAGLLACHSGMADEVATDSEPRATTVDTEKVNRELAQIANKMAADQAAKSVIEATRLDLDIRLIGPTSVKIAGDQ